jgi:RNA polymerase sigma-70 factor (ECF subfamily)
MPPLHAQAALSEEPSPDAAQAHAFDRIREVVIREYAVVWRFLRRLGVPPSDVDDATQIALARTLARCEVIAPNCERAYLMRTAYHLAFEYRRATRRTQERATEVDVDQLAAAELAPDTALQRQRDRELLDQALDRLPTELRAVLTLFELEGMTFTEIASVLELPRGTVASRLRRARAEFKKSLSRLRKGVSPWS